MQVSIQIKPIVDSKGTITQIVFIISPARVETNQQKHTDLRQARKQIDAFALELKQQLQQANMNQLASRLEFFAKNENDLITALELEDHTLHETINLTDVAKICKQVVESRTVLAQEVGVSLQFTLPEDEAAEEVLLNMNQDQIQNSQMPLSDFAVPVDPKWLFIVVQKLVDLAILLVIPQKQKVHVFINRVGTESVSVAIVSYGVFLKDEEKDHLFDQYYGPLINTLDLRQGSGLEGFIAKMICSRLGIPLDIRSTKMPPSTVFFVSLPKHPRTT